MGVTYVAGKIAAAIGGLLGGLGFMAFLKPKTIMDATIRGGVSTGSAIIGSTVFIELLGFPNNIEFQLFSGAVIGFVAWGILGLIARVFIKAEQKNTDAIEFISDVKTIGGVKAPAEEKAVVEEVVKETPKKKRTRKVNK